MTTELRLHYAPDNASLCVRLALELLEQPYRPVLVDRRNMAHKSPAYLALNPNGLIPVLETPHGPVSETAAILIWLAESYGDARLMPQPADPARGAALQWMLWLSNTLHPTLRMGFYPAQFSTAPDSLHTQPLLTARLDLLEQAKDAPWLDADCLSAMTCYLLPMLRWAALYGTTRAWFRLDRWPRLLDCARRLETLPPVARAATAEGLGPTPFSAPHPCNPPEGSAV